MSDAITGETSDGFHTFNELYEHRAMLTAALASLVPYDVVWKSKLHHDGTMFDGMFIVGFETPDGTATYHYDIDPWWGRFPVQELDRAFPHDGHTSADVLTRIPRLIEELRQMPPAHDERMAECLRDMVDEDPCDFDHHGGCQAHGYISLGPGEECPHAEAKRILDQIDADDRPGGES